MFISDTPMLDTAICLVITAVFVIVIARIGLLATVAVLVTHFVLLRAPITTDLSSWRAATGSSSPSPSCPGSRGRRDRRRPLPDTRSAGRFS